MVLKIACRLCNTTSQILPKAKASHFEISHRLTGHDKHKYNRKLHIQWSLPKRTNLVARIEFAKHVIIVKQSPKSGHLSTTDKINVPNVSVIRRLHCNAMK